MAKPLSAIEREEKSLEAVVLSAKGWSDVAIGKHLGINRATVKRLRDSEYARREEHREHDKEKAIAVYEAIIFAAWERFKNTNNTSLNSAGFLNTIKAAQDSINRITGAESPIKIQDVDGDWDVIWADADEAALRE